MRKFLLILSSLLLLTACGGRRAPVSLAVIGITCSRSSSGATQLATTYTEAIQRAGGVAVVLPTLDSYARAEELVGALDGVVFSGGEDVSPSWYGEEPWNETVRVDAVRDLSDSLLARAALASGKPILAICRGEQLMNVVMGGSLYQDLPSQFGTEVRHGGGATHTIGLEPGSVLAEIYGTDSLSVNSFHHQAVKALAPGVKATAHSADGLVEAYENDQVWAVQFHPEKDLQAGDTRWLRLFEAFVRRCCE